MPYNDQAASKLKLLLFLEAQHTVRRERIFL